MNIQLSGGQYENGKFYRHVNEVREDGSRWPTGYKMWMGEASNMAHRHTDKVLDLANRTSIAHAAQQYPRTLVKWH